MKPFEYAATTEGIIWICICVVLGFAVTALAYLIINRIPAKWLCDFDETPSPELLSGKRISYLPTAPAVSVLVAAALVMCRLQFNRGLDLPFLLMIPTVMCCLMIAISDLKYQIIPDQFTIALAVSGLLVSGCDLLWGYRLFHTAWWSPIAGAAICAGAMILIDLLGNLVYHKEGMGFGDVKLFAAVGLLAGFPASLIILALSILTATVFFVIALIVRGFRPEEKAFGEVKDVSAKDEAVAAEADKPSDKEEAASEKDEPGAVREEAPGAETGEASQNKEGSAEDLTEEVPEEEDAYKGYLAFGPYIAAALVVYLAFYDQVLGLLNMYLDLFR